MASLLKPDGSVSEVVPANPASGFSLDELYALLGCDMIETVSLADGIGTLVIDEEGKLKPHLRNARATMLLHVAGGADDDYIAGSALVCNGNELQ